MVSEAKQCTAASASSAPAPVFEESNSPLQGYPLDASAVIRRIRDLLLRRPSLHAIFSCSAMERDRQLYERSGECGQVSERKPRVCVRTACSQFSTAARRCWFDAFALATKCRVATISPCATATCRSFVQRWLLSALVEPDRGSSRMAMENKSNHIALGVPFDSLNVSAVRQMLACSILLGRSVNHASAFLCIRGTRPSAGTS